ncbi:zinc ribbon domain-containing protein [Micromonospora inositola]|uniref:zinc ribbon domain-containing protein n=1 Tax=Micromonospora inositola TaxID=47865 RepID=UPI001E4C9752|nr:hypothetical protein [Micromonospora inositola]
MTRPWLRAFGVVAAVELVGVAFDLTALQWLAKPLLAPLLLAYLWAARRRADARIIRDNQAVYVEDLCVVGLGRTRLAKSVHDAGWDSFTAMLEYKAARLGRTFGRIDRFFPSTRMCSQCGRINAAMNVLAAGRADNSNDRGAQVRPPAMVAPRGEAVIHPDAACSTRSVEGISVLLGGENVNSSSPWAAASRRTPVPC